jgi:hypothetical protein
VWRAPCLLHTWPLQHNAGFCACFRSLLRGYYLSEISHAHIL